MNDKICILKKIIKIIKHDDKEIDINEHTKIEDLSLDSLDLLEIQMLYEDETGNTMLDIKKKINTINDLISLMP